MGSAYFTRGWEGEGCVHDYREWGNDGLAD